MIEIILSTGSKYIIYEEYSDKNTIEDCLHNVIDYYIENGEKEDEKIYVPN